MRFVLGDRKLHQRLEYLFPQTPKSPYCPESVIISIYSSMDLFSEDLRVLDFIAMAEDSNYHHTAVETIHQKAGSLGWSYKSTMVRGAYAPEDNFNYGIQMNDQSKVVNRWPTHHLDSVELHNTYDVDTLGTVIPFPQEHVYAQENGENGISKDVLGIQNGNEFILNADQTLSLKEQQENIDRRMNKRRVPNFGRRKYIPKGNPHHPFKGFRKYHKTCPRYHESRDDPPRVFKPGVIERLRKTNCVRPRSDILKKDSPDESSNPTDNGLN